MTILDGVKISNQIKAELKEKVEKLKAEGLNVPGLATILVGDDPASKIYVNSKKKACEEIGFFSVVVNMSLNISQEELLEIINKYNEDDRFHGILVQLPLPKHIDENIIIQAISPNKDVDGFHPNSAGNLVIGTDTFAPCTPAGIQELLIRYEIETQGKHAVIVGRSNIVGKPIANMLIQKKKGANCVVTVCHSACKDISFFTKQADILIAAIGKPKFITKDMIKEGAVVIDVGINRINDEGSPKGCKVVGDVDFDNAAEKCSFITPVPGGVGKMTIAMLMMNTYKSRMKFLEKRI